MRVVATFSGAKYHDTTARIVEDSPKLGADAVWVTDDHWLRIHRPAYWDRVAWFRNHRHAREERPRGVDFFCFKSFTILDAFRRLSDGDTLLWLDADTYPIVDLGWLFDRCESDGGAMLFGARGCINGVWTKRDVFVAMGCDAPEYHNALHTVARFMLLRKGGTFPVERFLGEWLGFTANPIINTFQPNVLGLPDLPGFQQSRCEQSVLSNLAVKYGLPRYREACQFGGWPGPAQTNEVDIPQQFFVQSGGHTYRPGFAGDESEGSAWRNIND